MVAQTPLAYQYGIVRSRWKLIYDEQQRNYQLFDLSADPGEKINLAEQNPMPLKQLANRLHAWRATQIKYYGDTVWHSRESANP